ncbi:MAG: 6-pyruvoyl trahydropterin synthase family protein [Methylohalobius sp. ZOD2]|uniref:6-pyruvoyl trahydropterin synthase family protein n=1 Tax=Methylohalobius crimeensis TaxID=244365 RepID=UPI0003B74217|nr:6-carboxytetrahydropterin synthase [Methylohalobius crimeensis]
MYQLGVSRDFIAQHYLVGGDFGPENLRHSHPYRLEVRLSGENLDRHGYLVDITQVEEALDHMLGRFGDRCLNDLEEFSGLNPSLEHFCRIVWEHLQDRLDLKNIRLEVRMWENANAWTAYDGG